MSTDFSIRACRRDDLGAVFGIENACYGADALDRIAVTQYLDLFAPSFLVAEHVRDAEHAEEIVGFVIAGATLGDAPRVGWILDVAVRPSHQGRGIAPAMCRRAIEELERREIRTVRATVAPQNERSLRTFARLGFRVVEAVEDYFGPDEKRLVVEWTSVRE